MGFYELGNGCDSCDTISSVIPGNVNMQMDQNSALAANMAYGAQANGLQQYNNSVASAGYGQQGNTMGSMGSGSNGSTMGVPQQNQKVQPKVVKQIVTTTTTTSAPILNNNNAPKNNNNMNNNSNNNNTNDIEGFTDTMNNNLMNNDKKWIVLGLVIFTALASNECCKYFLNKSLQLNDGSPMYYVAYVGVAILLTMAVNKYANTN